MGTLQKFYSDLVADPYKIFMVMPDGQIIDRQGIYAFADRDEGAFSMCELAVVPGSFNPLHAAHRLMIDNIPGYQHSGSKKCVEISLRRMGKPDLTVEELTKRIAQFEFYVPVLVTNAARFVEKCAVISGDISVSWHVGIDTILRMRDDYGELGIGGLKGYFTVWDRDMGDGLMQYPHDFKILPHNVQRCHHQIPVELRGMSSTKIRNSLLKQ